MAIAPAAAVDSHDGVDAPDLRLFDFGLFFIFGGITSLNDVIIPTLKDLFTLRYAQAMLLGRFIGAFLLRLVSPGKLLAAVAIALLALSANSGGAIAPPLTGAGADATTLQWTWWCRRSAMR